MSFVLEVARRKAIERRRQRTRDYRLARRLSALLWRDDGKAGPEIAHLLGVGARTGLPFFAMLPSGPRSGSRWPI
jgi:hypothetical protein